MAKLDIEVRHERGVAVVVCSGSLSIGPGAAALRDALGELLDGGARRIVLVYGAVSYMDSAGVGETVASYKRALESGAVVKVVLPREGPVRRVFAVTCLDRVFEVFHDEAEALASFRD